MSRPFPLHPLLDLSHTRVDEATRRLGELIAMENEGSRKLELLKNYRTEYQSRFHEAARDGMGPEAWRNYSAFLARIDDAIAAQMSQLTLSRHRTVAGKEQWLHERNRLKAFDTLKSRHVAREARSEARQEQRRSDEHTANRHHHKLAEDGHDN